MAFGGPKKGDPFLNIGNNSIVKNITGALGNLGSVLSDPSSARLSINKLLPGGFPGIGGNTPNINFGIEQLGTAGSISTEDDWRVRITAPSGSPFNFNTGPLAALAQDGGVVFPYTPTVNVIHNASYNNLTPTHSNYPSYFYNNSEVAGIQISADFTAQTTTDAAYVLGMIWFFRSATKMFYGGQNSGNPPPILYLDGYGDYYLPHVPVVVTNFGHTMPSNTDYIETQVSSNQVTSVKSFGGDQLTPSNIPGIQAQSSLNNASENFATQERLVETKGSKQRVPTKSSINIGLQPVYSRDAISNKFNWEDFSKGNLLKGKGGFL
jgi:hypothetical protein